ncbi:MAG: hypothetical protein PHT99_01375, partial [Methanoregula sp.]|nr:hypothetical protein [Methanoregula sp.]
MILCSPDYVCILLLIRLVGREENRARSLYYPPFLTYTCMQTPDPARIRTALADATFRAYREAVIRLPLDVLKVIGNAARGETNAVARSEFANILANIKTARG